jgi:hypothetical protein
MFAWAVNSAFVSKGVKKGESIVNEFLGGFWQAFTFYEQGNSRNFFDSRL